MLCGWVCGGRGVLRAARPTETVQYLKFSSTSYTSWFFILFVLVAAISPTLFILGLISFMALFCFMFVPGWEFMASLKLSPLMSALVVAVMKVSTDTRAPVRTILFYCPLTFSQRANTFTLKDEIKIKDTSKPPGSESGLNKASLSLIYDHVVVGVESCFNKLGSLLITVRGLYLDGEISCAPALLGSVTVAMETMHIGGSEWSCLQGCVSHVCVSALSENPYTFVPNFSVAILRLSSRDTLLSSGFLTSVSRN